MNATISIHGKIYARITRKQAENLYNAGVTITLYPRKYGDGYYQNLSAYHINRKIGAPEKTFTEMVDWYESEYCYDSDTGKSAAYYIETTQNIW